MTEVNGFRLRSNEEKVSATTIVDMSRDEVFRPQDFRKSASVDVNWHLVPTVDAYYCLQINHADPTTLNQLS